MLNIQKFDFEFSVNSGYCLHVPKTCNYINFKNRPELHWNEINKSIVSAAVRTFVPSKVTSPLFMKSSYELNMIKFVF